MTLSDLASLATFVSGIAVLVSLVYLAVQVRQSRKHTAAQISHSRVDTGVESQRMIVADPVVADLLLRGAQGSQSLNGADGLRFQIFVTNVLIVAEDEFRQYKDRLISEEGHRGFVKRFSRIFEHPGYRAMWALLRDGFEADFQATVDPLVEEGRRTGPRDMDGAWHALVATELAMQSAGSTNARS